MSCDTFGHFAAQKLQHKRYSAVVLFEFVCRNVQSRREAAQHAVSGLLAVVALHAVSPRFHKSAIRFQCVLESLHAGFCGDARAITEILACATDVKEVVCR